MHFGEVSEFFGFYDAWLQLLFFFCFFYNFLIFFCVYFFAFLWKKKILKRKRKKIIYKRISFILEICFYWLLIVLNFFCAVWDFWIFRKKEKIERKEKKRNVLMKVYYSWLFDERRLPPDIIGWKRKWEFHRKTYLDYTLQYSARIYEKVSFGCIVVQSSRGIEV